MASLAAWYKYGDRTEIVAKSLQGTKEALDELRIYLARSLGGVLLPLIKEMIKDRRTADELATALSGEQFQDAISEFVNQEIDEMVTYRRLLHARQRWSIWARKLSWAIYLLMCAEGLFLCFFFLWGQVFSHTVGKVWFACSLSISVLITIRCVYCFGLMLYFHDQISTYREKIL